jgi:hypothetical protein
MKTLEKMSEGRWSVIENDIGPRITALVLIVLLLGYSIVGALE